MNELLISFVLAAILTIGFYVIVYFLGMDVAIQVACLLGIWFAVAMLIYLLLMK
jgi:hypothetical protein